MGCHRDFTTECAWRSHLQFPHPPSQLAPPCAILASHGVASMAPPLSTSTPRKSPPCTPHTRTHSAQPSSLTHAPSSKSTSNHTSLPSLPKPLPLPLPPSPSPSSLHAAHGGTHAHAPSAVAAMPCSRLLSVSPHFTHTTSTINSTTTTTIIPTTTTKTKTIKTTDQSVHHHLRQQQRHRLHLMQQTPHPLHSFTPVATSNPLRACPPTNLQILLPLPLSRSLHSRQHIHCQTTTIPQQIALLKPSSS
nr:hypothetical protein HmN_000500300 [Hymenolepis microstoma]